MSWTLADTDASIPERFEQQARLEPDRRAVAGDVTFSELDAAANGWANALLDRAGDGPAQVALLLPHDAQLVAAALGALKAGKTVVALNPRDPARRIGEIRADARPEALITDPAHRDQALAAGFAVEELVLERGSDKRPGVAVEPDRAAFLIYTSGSTGAPKGVVQTHRNMLHNVLRHTSGAGLSHDDRVLLLASVGSGQGVGVVWSTLLNGATLCPFPLGARGLGGLAETIREEGVTVFVASASLFRTYTRTLNGERLEGLRLVRLASEAAVRDDFDAFRRHFPDAALLNTFSASETGNIARWLLAAEADPPDPLPVGLPAEGIELRLIRGDGTAAGPDETGEIVVASEFLSPGYWQNQALTAERFEHGRFRTGDLGRLSEDGVLTIVGRADFRVKVHGYNVDLADVEAALNAQPGVAAAAVRAETSERGGARLAAFVSPAPGQEPTAVGLRDALRASLPEHAVPTKVTILSELPLAPSGKIDRGRLETPSEAEELLTGLWADALELDTVGLDDDFFELGGDSLMAAVIAAGVHAALGVELELGAFVSAPTVAAMACLVEGLRGRGGSQLPPLERLPRDRPLRASFAQERLWRNSKTEVGRIGHNMATALRLRGPLDQQALQRAIQQVAARHESLRTTFAEREGRLVQVVRPPREIELPFVDLSGEPSPGQSADALIAREARKPFDLEAGPLLRVLLVRIAEDEHRLLRVNHHIVSDGWSWSVFFEELGVLYDGEELGPEPRIQYGDFAAWQRCVLEPGSPESRRSIDWWSGVFAEPHEPLTLPFARSAAPSGIDPSDGAIWWGLRREVSQAIDRLARRNAATFYMVRLAVFTAQLGLETGRDDLVVGGYVTNRRLPELQALFGDFTNLVTLRLRFDPGLGFREWLARVRAVVLETAAHRELPYALLVERLGERGIAAPEIRTVFSRTHQLAPWRMGELELQPLPSQLQLVPTGFTFGANRWYESYWCHAYFDPRSYERLGVVAFAARFAQLAAKVSADPDRPLGKLV